MSQNYIGTRKPLRITRRAYMLSKRLIDSALVVASAPVTLPVGLATAALVRLKMGSPILYKQDRIGLGEKPFELYKFRSMLPETTDKGQALTPSERITPFGAFLRKSSLDELPQLLNVLKGDMSLVGPRPLLVEYLPFYKENERARHSVRPGITGHSQVNGRNSLGWDERLAMDAEYSRKGTLYSDLQIIIKTIKGVLKRDGIIAEPWTHGEYLSVYRNYPSTGKYALRRFEPQDIAQRVNWLNDSRTRESLTVEGEITVDGTAKWLQNARKNPNRKDVVVYDLESLKMVAIAGFKSDSSENVPILYFAVDPELQGRGIGSVTLQLLVEYMRSQPEVSGAAGEIYTDNIASIKIHQRLGFEEVEAELPSNRLRMEIKW